MKIVRRFEQNQLASREASPVKESLTTAQAVAVPEGFVMVPVEPTEAILGAIADAIFDDLPTIDIYRAMLAAAKEADHG